MIYWYIVILITMWLCFRFHNEIWAYETKWKPEFKEESHGLRTCHTLQPISEAKQYLCLWLRVPPNQWLPNLCQRAMSWQIHPIAKPKRGDALPCMVQYCHDRSPIWLVLSLRLGKDNMYTPSLCIGYIELNCLRNWIEGMWFAVQLALSGCGVPWNMHFHHLSTLIFQDFCCSIQGEYTAQMVMCLNLWLLSSWFNSFIF